MACDFSGYIFHKTQIRAAVWSGRRGNSNENCSCIINTFNDTGRKFKQSLFGIFYNQFLKTGFIYRNNIIFKFFYLFFIIIYTNNFMSNLSKTSPGYKTNISSSNYTYFHFITPLNQNLS
ncbi:MAG: hypothetical protein ACD_79C00473G0002 [uncultured bacterium]|nr:MAG: hypothetical protein ACD_79C00473G0002 [uncultured bacterium]